MNDALKLAEKVEHSIAEKRLFGRGQSILVAVSGGLDSMALLHLLARMAGAHGWRLTVAHFNHQLRGRASDADERLVKRAAKKLGLRFVTGRGKVRQFARAHKLSLEMAARKLRHGFLACAAGRRGIAKIALAHHADDQVELFFVRLLRGAGGEGLAGMKWLGPSPVDARIMLARPLLDQLKATLAAYVKQEKIVFREDASNARLHIQRNRIRHELLPLLVKNYQPALARMVSREMEIVGAEAEFVTRAALKWLKGGRRPVFESLPAALQRRCLQLQLAGRGLTPNFDLIEQLRGPPDRPVAAGAGARVCRDAAGRVVVEEPGGAGFDGSTARIRLTGRPGKIVFGNVKIAWKMETARSGIFRAPKRRVNCEYFDAAKLGSDIVLRHWRAGDRFQPIGMSRPVKLQDLFTNQKISRALRHRLLVGAAAGGELFWVERLRMGEHFKLDEKSRYQLKWRWKRL